MTFLILLSSLLILSSSALAMSDPVLMSEETGLPINPNDFNAKFDIADQPTEEELKEGDPTQGAGLWNSGL
jgi:hypothetical protein